MKIKALESKIAAKTFELGYCLPMELCIAIGEEVTAAMKKVSEKLQTASEKEAFSDYVKYVQSCYNTHGETAVSKGHLKLVEEGFYTQEEVDEIAADTAELEQYWNEVAKPTLLEMSA